MRIEKTIEETIVKLAIEFAEREGCASIPHINSGKCEKFRDLLLNELYLLHPNAPFGMLSNLEFYLEGDLAEPFHELMEMHYHVWLEYKGRHYDAETPKGVDHWFDLPFYRKMMEISNDERISVFNEYMKANRSEDSH